MSCAGPNRVARRDDPFGFNQCFARTFQLPAQRTHVPGDLGIGLGTALQLQIELHQLHPEHPQLVMKAIATRGLVATPLLESLPHGPLSLE